MARAKISIIGGGNVGSSCALWAASKELGDVVVLDIPEMQDKTRGKMLDLAQCAPVERFDSAIHATADYADTAGSGVVIVTAGIPRKPGMSRDDLIQTNVKIVKSVAEQAQLVDQRLRGRGALVEGEGYGGAGILCRGGA